MAKITIDFDTETKGLNVAIDGASVENVRCIDICPKHSPYDYGYDKDDDEDEYCVHIETVMKDEATDIYHHHRMVASDVLDEHGFAPSEKFPGFVESSRKGNPLHSAIASFLGK